MQSGQVIDVMMSHSFIPKLEYAHDDKPRRVAFKREGYLSPIGFSVLPKELRQGS